MKINTSGSITETNIGNSVGFSIETNPIALEILSKNLYQNVPRAIIRELCANAIDANIMAGVDPYSFEICLPTDTDPTFSVEDFGIGMTKEEVLHTYTTFFSSSKRDTNEQIGMFGLGSKTPFAYTSQFVIVSSKDGQRNTFAAFKDGVGGFRVSHIETENVPNDVHGTKVSFPVNGIDRTRFIAEFLYCLHTFKQIPTIINTENFYSYISQAFNIKTSEVSKKLEYMIKRFSKTFPGHKAEDLLMNVPLETLMLEMGGILYEVKFSELLTPLPYDVYTVIKHMNLQFSIRYGVTIIHANIGDVSITPSREELQYDEKTCKFICYKVVECYLTEFLDIQDKFDTCKISVSEEKNLESIADLKKFGYIDNRLLNLSEDILNKIDDIEKIIIALKFLDGSYYFFKPQDNIEDIFSEEKMPSFKVSMELQKMLQVPTLTIEMRDYLSIIRGGYPQPRIYGKGFVTALDNDFSMKSNVFNGLEHSAALKVKVMSFIKKYCEENDVSPRHLGIIFVKDNDVTLARQLANLLGVEYLPFETILSTPNLFKKTQAVKKQGIKSDKVTDIEFSVRVFRRKEGSTPFSTFGGGETKKTWGEIKDLRDNQGYKVYILPERGSVKSPAEFLNPKVKVKDLKFCDIKPSSWIERLYYHSHVLTDYVSLPNVVAIIDNTVDKYRKVGTDEFEGAFDYYDDHFKNLYAYVEKKVEGYGIGYEDIEHDKRVSALKEIIGEELSNAHPELNPDNSLIKAIFERTLTDNEKTRIEKILSDRNNVVKTFWNLFHDDEIVKLLQKNNKEIIKGIGEHISNIFYCMTGTNKDFNLIKEKYRMLGFIANVAQDSWSQELIDEVVDYIAYKDGV